MSSNLHRPPISGPDKQLAALQLAQSHAQKPTRGWLRDLRTRLGMSQQKVAKKISMVRQSYADLESSEERGAISLVSLERAAAAMDCDLVYYLVPRGKTVSRKQNQGSPDDSVFEPAIAIEPTLDPSKDRKQIVSTVYLSDEELPTVLK